MRILEAVSTPGLNGAVLYARRIIPELQARGHEIALAALPDSWIAREMHGEVEIIETRFERWPLDELRRFAGLIREREIDLVHSHLTRANNFCALLHALFGVRNVCHSHENKPHPHYWFHDLVIAVSRDTLRRHRRYGAALGRRGTVLPNFVDTRVFKPVDPNVTTDPLREAIGVGSGVPVIVQIGQVDKRKGQVHTLEALPLVWKEHPDAQMVFIGHGKPLPHPPDPRIHWLGLRDDIPELLPWATVSILPSVVEPFGLTAIESMACKIPLVASRVGGLREIVREGTGVLVEPGSSAPLASAINNLLSSAELRKQLLDDGARHVSENFALEPHVCRLEELLTAFV